MKTQKLTDEEFELADNIVSRNLRKSAKGPERDAAQATADEWNRLCDLPQATVRQREARYAALYAFAKTLVQL